LFIIVIVIVVNFWGWIVAGGGNPNTHPWSCLLAG